MHQQEPQAARSIGASIFAILISQVGLLALLLSFSVFLQTESTVATMAWGIKGLMMLVVGVAYLVLAFGLWTQKPWSRIYSWVTLAIVLISAIVNTMDDKVLDLGFVLVFFICCAANFVLIAWFQMPGVRQPRR